jgi:hypothetical protein
LSRIREVGKKMTGRIPIDESGKSTGGNERRRFTGDESKKSMSILRIEYGKSRTQTKMRLFIFSLVVIDD